MAVEQHTENEGIALRDAREGDDGTTAKNQGWPIRHLHHGLLHVFKITGREAWRVRGDMLRAVRLMLVLVVLCGGVFPLLLFAIGQAAFPSQANGSLLVNANGQLIGSSLIEQQFTRPEYFHGRPSAVGDNAAGSG